MNYEHITSDAELQQFCDASRAAKYVAFDTEFVSEDSYRPHLCLIQVAADDQIAVIDPLAIRDVTPFWQLVVDPGHVTVVHSGREEFLFCRRAVERRPSQLFDTQIAAGLIGLEYPAAYSTLLSKLLNRKLPKGETRTDWRRRPLSRRQMDYAVQDVLHLPNLFELLSARLDELGRSDWLSTEMNSWQKNLEAAASQMQWRRVSGIANLSRRSLAIVRELWRWREEQAEKRNQPAKRVLRDDLIVELARRQSADVHRIRAVRGLNYRGIQRHIPELAQCVRRGLEVPDDECPASSPRRSARSQLNLLTQFLSTALGTICRDAQLAPALVGSSQDMRDLIAFHLEIDGFTPQDAPALARGWRAGVVGQRISNLLDGQLTLRVSDPLADQPLALEARDHVAEQRTQ